MKQETPITQTLHAVAGQCKWLRRMEDTPERRAALDDMLSLLKELEKAPQDKPMQLVRTEHGLQVHRGGIPDDRELYEPSSEINITDER